MNVTIIILLLLIDLLGTSIAWLVTYYLRVESGLFISPMPIEMFKPIILLTIFWWVLFALRGMYRTPIAISRFDEVIQCFKAVFVGIIIIFVATIDIEKPVNMMKFFLLTYGLSAFILLSIGRVIIRVIQRKLRSKGVGLWNAVIVGFNDTGKKLHNQLHFFPVWGFNVVGFVDEDVQNGEHLSRIVLGSVTELPEIIAKKHIQFVLIAPERKAPEALMEVIRYCEFQGLRFMIVANYYQMVVGLVRTFEIHGLPLVEVMPHLVTFSTRFIKLALDMLAGIVMSVVVLLVTPLIGLLIKIDSPGSVFYIQKRVGRGGNEFKLIKFRTMYSDAEKNTGAIWAKKNDPRITRIGRILRDTYLDELPQFVNVLMGQMSVVGPRPERLEFTEQFNKQIPLYDRRLRIKPGITGWAQVRHKYDENLKDVIEKTSYDLFYIDHISLTLDLKIIIATIIRVLKCEGH
ncbi:MAG: sugar transferase [Candidatus Hatepunaea meridiana]|nr:sugar transferase [Candidatus Hatepunaea meridiana]